MQPERPDAGTPNTWLANEPGMRWVRGELARACRRARFRWKTIFAITAALSLLVATGSVLKKRTFEPHFVLRVLEADRDPNMAPRPKRRLREYVEQAVFSNGHLLEIIKKHGLYPTLARNNPQAALETFREDIVVDVYRNYFIEERAPDDPPRSARISIGCRSSNRNLALAVTRDLGNLVVEHEAETRKRQAADAAKEATAALVKARDDLQTHEEKLERKARELVNKDSNEARVEFTSLTHSVEGMQQRLNEAEKRKAAFDVGSIIEQHGLGLNFEVVDSGAVSVRYDLAASDVAWLGIITFLLLAPLVTITVGAFDARIIEEEDLERLGLNILGRVHERHLPGGDWA